MYCDLIRRAEVWEVTEQLKHILLAVETGICGLTRLHRVWNIKIHERMNRNTTVYH